MECHLPVADSNVLTQSDGLPMVRKLSLVGLVGIVLLPTLVFANEGGSPTPGPNDRQITLAVKSYLEREHFLRKPIDDEIAARWFDTFLSALDPLKIYFLQSDVDSFAERKSSLDDLVRRGDVSFAYEVYDRFLERVDERIPIVEELLKSKLDFNQKESIVIDRDIAVWAKTQGEVRDKWKKRIKYDLLVQKMEKISPEEARKKLLRRYTSFAKRMHQMNADELLETYL